MLLHGFYYYPLSLSLSPDRQTCTLSRLVAHHGHFSAIFPRLFQRFRSRLHLVVVQLLAQPIHAGRVHVLSGSRCRRAVCKTDTTPVVQASARGGRVIGHPIQSTATTHMIDTSPRTNKFADFSRQIFGIELHETSHKLC